MIYFRTWSFSLILCNNMCPLSCGLCAIIWCGDAVNCILIIKTIGREIYRNILLCELYWFFTTAKRKEGWGGGLNISYLTSSPKPLHGHRETWREARTQGLLSSLFILGRSISFLSIPFLFSFSKKKHVYSGIQCVQHNYLLSE